MTTEIVKIDIENEMDLVLANKRTMKLAELSGLSLTVQTALATAVSEIARVSLPGKKTSLMLGIHSSSASKHISALICGAVEQSNDSEAVNLARKLIGDVLITKANGCYDVQLNQTLKSGLPITEARIESLIQYFKTEPPLSPYDEIRRKNILLLELSGKLKASENQYRALTDTLPIMMFLANPAGKIIFTNRWLSDYFELVTIAPTFTGHDLVHPDDIQRLSADWARKFDSGTSFHADGRLKRKNSNTYFWHLISILPIKDQDGIAQWTGFFVDIHAQKLVEETLKDNVELKETQKKLVEQQKLLEEKIDQLNLSNHELQQFAYIASHDLQEPLRKIATFSDLLSEKGAAADTESQSYLRRIVASTERMSNLIRGVLDWSVIGKAKEEFSPVDLNLVLTSIKSDFELVIQKKNAVIQHSALPTLNAIPSQILQLFSNLLANSLKFSAATPAITLSSRSLNRTEIMNHKRLDTSKKYAVIIFSDNGIGFEQQYSDRIFEIFQRLNGHHEYPGTGIGLAICKKIVENHHGVIYATSTPGQGATFSMILPLGETMR
jgi:signal transduction histidine kinase